MVYLRKVFRRYFNEWISAIVLVCMFLGTNLYFYTVIEGPMSHIHNVALLSILLWNLIKWYEEPSWKRSIYIGLCMGMLVLIRPTNALFALVVALAMVDSFKEIPARIKLLISEYQRVIVMVITAFAVFFLQMIYWKVQTGSWLYYSYEGESFFFNNPHLMEGFFGYRKGLFVYTPMAFFGFLGILLMAFKKDALKEWRASIFLVVPLFYYVAFSWWCWWYGGSFGNRGSIESFPFLFLGLGALLTVLWNYKRFLVYGLLPIFAFFIYLNRHQSYQFVEGSLHYDSMTKEAYWQTFLMDYPTVEYYDLLSPPNYDDARDGRPEFSDWKELNQAERTSNRFSFESDDAGKTVVVEGTIFSDLHPSIGMLHLVVEPTPLQESDSSNYYIIPGGGSADIHFSIPVEIPEVGPNQKAEVFLFYGGKGKSYYKPITLKQ